MEPIIEQPVGLTPAPPKTPKNNRIFWIVVCSVALLVLGAIGLWFGFMSLSQQSSESTTQDSTESISLWAPIVATTTDYKYTSKNNTVVFKKHTDSTGSFVDVSIQTSPSAFLVSTVNARFGKDKQHVYYSGIVTAGADPDTFFVLDSQGYAKDAVRVYYEVDSSDLSDSFTPIVGADSKTFTSIGHKYAKDAHHVFLKGKMIEGADAPTFTFVGIPKATFNPYMYYTKDSRNVYFEGGMLSGADPQTFVFIPDMGNDMSLYAKDKNHVYDTYIGTLVEGADPESFVVLNSIYAKDKKNVYSGDPHVIDDTGMFPIKGADPSTFVLVKGNPSYDARDKNHKYLRAEVIQ